MSRLLHFMVDLFYLPILLILPGNYYWQENPMMSFFTIMGGNLSMPHGTTLKNESDAEAT